MTKTRNSKRLEDLRAQIRQHPNLRDAVERAEFEAMALRRFQALDELPPLVNPFEDPALTFSPDAD